MTTPLMFALAEAPEQLTQVGGKVLPLIPLLRARLPVPPGFVIGAEVMGQILHHEGLLPLLEKLDQGGYTPQALNQLQEQILTLKLPKFMEEPLAQHWHLLGGGVVAVRSSGIQEDLGTASFAGQYHTSLGITWPQLWPAILRCWASAFSEAVICYRRSRGLPLRQVGMAVFVQVMVTSRVSGVLFTVNPLNGSRREMSLDSGWGLGDAYVSGQAAADNFLCSRPLQADPQAPIHILHQVVVPKPRQLVLGEAGETQWVDVPEGDREIPSLDPTQVEEIGRLGLAVEALLLGPRDVEWAIDHGGTLFLLQARPITTVAPDKHRSRRDVLWTQRFSGERWTETASVLGWSIIDPILHHFVFYQDASRRFLHGSAATRLFLGQPYFNITIFRHLLFKFPGAVPPQFLLEFFPREEQEEILRAPWILPDLELVRSIIQETRAEKRWERFEWNGLTNFRIWQEFLPGFERAIAALPDTPPSPAACRTAVDEGRALIVSYLRIHVISLAFASIFYQVLQVLLRRWAGEGDPFLPAALTAHGRGNKTFETNMALWELARLAERWPAVRAALTDGEALPPVEQLERVAGGGPFLLALHNFIRQYGHRSTASWEIFSPRWVDTPEIPLGLVRSYLRAGPGRDPSEIEERSRREQIEAEHRVLELIRRHAPPGQQPRRVWLFQKLLHLTRNYTVLRENQRFYFDQLLYKIKSNLSHMGLLWAERGLLEQAADLPFLNLEEVDDVLGGHLDALDLRALVHLRREQQTSDRQVERPVFLRGDLPYREMETHTASTLSGLGISPGRIRGRVRIVRNLTEGAKLGRGDILVTHATDPGWTPLFLTAGGLIMELGSLLSHGAVVAREYHLPAVVNISEATRLLHDGQEVTLDGSLGMIYLH